MKNCKYHFEVLDEVEFREIEDINKEYLKHVNKLDLEYLKRLCGKRVRVMEIVKRDNIWSGYDKIIVRGINFSNTFDAVLFKLVSIPNKMTYYGS